MYECININIPPINMLIEFAVIYECPIVIIFFNNIHPITLKTTDNISEISDIEKIDILFIYNSSVVFIFIVGISPDMPIIKPIIFFFVIFSFKIKNAISAVKNGEILYIIQAFDEDILFNPHISNMLFKYILNMVKYIKNFMSENFIFIICFCDIYINIIKPANVILKPIKKNGSEYFKLIFCNENILANKANNVNTNRNRVFFNFFFFLIC